MLRVSIREHGVAQREGRPLVENARLLGSVDSGRAGHDDDAMVFELASRLEYVARAADDDPPQRRSLVTKPAAGRGEVYRAFALGHRTS